MTLNYAEKSKKSQFDERFKKDLSKHGSRVRDNFRQIGDNFCSVVKSMCMNEEELGRFRTQICPDKADGECPLEESCSFSHCLSFHRRPPYQTGYSHTLCPNVIFSVGKKDRRMKVKSFCKRGRQCLFSHTKEEQMYHPVIYKTMSCRDWPECAKFFCPFAHGPGELRDPALIQFDFAQGPEYPEKETRSRTQWLAIYPNLNKPPLLSPNNNARVVQQSTNPRQARLFKKKDVVLTSQSPRNESGMQVGLFAELTTPYLASLPSIDAKMVPPRNDSDCSTIVQRSGLSLGSPSICDEGEPSSEFQPPSLLSCSTSSSGAKLFSPSNADSPPTDLDVLLDILVANLWTEQKNSYMRNEPETHACCQCRCHQAQTRGETLSDWPKNNWDDRQIT